MQPGLLVIVPLSSSGGHVDYPVRTFINMTRRQTAMCAGAKPAPSPAEHTDEMGSFSHFSFMELQTVMLTYNTFY